MSKEELRSAVPGSDKLLKSVMEFLASKNEIVDQSNLVRLASHKVRLKEEEKDVKNSLSRMIIRGRNAPPVFKEIVAASGTNPKEARSLLGILEKEGVVVRISEELYFSNDFIEEVKKKLVEFMTREGGLTPSQFHEITGSSRKYNIPLLEYLDRQRFTMRVGDQRVLRGSGSSGEGGKVE